MNLSFDRLSQLNIEALYGPSEQTVSSLAFHSGRVQPDAAFFCLKGENFDGHAYIEDAIARGAAVIIGREDELFRRMSEVYTRTTVHCHRQRTIGHGPLFQVLLWRSR